jgi:hypothetical protein
MAMAMTDWLSHALSETFNHIPDMFDFFKFILQSINLGDYTPQPGDLRVGILHHVTFTIAGRLDGVF